MGLGDWIMASSQVREMNMRTGQKVVVIDRMGRPRWSEVFENNPRMARSSRSSADIRLLNAAGARPYIKQKTDSHWIWKRWDIKPGEIFLSENEQRYAAQFRGRVLVEPNVKVPGSNKEWEFTRWQELVKLDLPWLQCGAAGTRRLAGVEFLETTARDAFAMLSVAKLFVGTEGALHHAAAAFATPAVVLWSEFISPTYTGYDTQSNIRKTGHVCGARFRCESCIASMRAISVEDVAHAIQGELQGADQQ